MAAALLLIAVLCSITTCTSQVIYKSVQKARTGENVTLQCQLTKKHHIVQITWQKEEENSKINIATYSKTHGITVLGKNNIYLSQNELNVSTIIFHGVTLKDEGCYNCIFNTFPLGSVSGRTCLKVHALTEPEVNVRRFPDPDNASEEILDISCVVSGRPTPVITWKLSKHLQIKPKEYIIQNPNQTATVISRFTYTYSRKVGKNTIACVIHHPSLNISQELTLPVMEMEEAPNEHLKNAISLIVGILVAILILGLLVFIICYYYRRLLPTAKRQGLLCLDLPICRRSAIFERYTYTQKPVTMKSFPEESVMNR